MVRRDDFGWSARFENTDPLLCPTLIPDFPALVCGQISRSFDELLFINPRENLKRLEYVN